MTRNQTVEINHLTVLQIQYLTELEQLEKGRGTIGAVATKCGVKHPTVSRFFKSCIEKGFIRFVQIVPKVQGFACEKIRQRLK